jgi:hypothetical protein
MATTSIKDVGTAVHGSDRFFVAPSTSGPTPRRGIAYGLSTAIAVLIVASSLSGLLIDGLYRDGAWAREALRGGDLTTLVLVVPVLIGSLALSIRGSRRAEVVWIGALAYSVYDYAYYVFGAAFNDVFVLHIALLALSIWALALSVSTLDRRAAATALGIGRSGRWVGLFLALVGSILGSLWLFLAVRFAITGELMADVPADGVHLVFAIDLSLLVPALVVAGVLLWRRTEAGTVFGAVMTVMGLLYQVNLLVSGVFQSNADVAGAKAFPLEGIVVAAGFAVSAAVLLGRRATTRSTDEQGRRTERWNRRW